MVQITALTLGLLAMFSAPTAGQPAPPSTSPTTEVGIDHLILAIDDLQKGIESFAGLTGVRPEFGGEHPGRGTANALVSLGQGRYLEILAPASKTAKLDPNWGEITQHKVLTPVGWALHSRDLAQTVATVRAQGLPISDPQPGSRKRPDGSTLTWQTAVLDGPQLALHPFFIQWGEGTAHPSTTSPQGCELVKVEIEAKDPAGLQILLRTVGVEVKVIQGSTQGMRFTLKCAKGEITFPGKAVAAPHK